MVRFAGNISTNVKHSANNILLEFSQIKLGIRGCGGQIFYYLVLMLTSILSYIGI